jgi:hypothetical protein
VIVPAHRPKYAPPITFGGQRVDYGDSLARELPDAGILRLKNARIVTAQGWVIGEDDCFLPDNSWFGYDNRPFDLSIYRRARLGPQTHIPGVSLNLTSEFAVGNYAHFLLDALARLHLFLATGNDLDSIDHVIVPTRKYLLLKRFLTRFGIDDSRIVTADEAPHARCDVLLAPSFPGKRRNSASWVVDFWRGCVASGTASPRRRLYVSRRGQRRSMANYAAIKPLLDRHGFKEIQGDVDPSLFAEAAVVVGEFGAGLADIVYCRPGARVVELTPPKHVLPHFYVLATAGGLSFHSVRGSYLPGAGWPINTQKEDFEVDPALLAEALDRVAG